MLIQICVGSSCHLKGSGRIVELMQEYIAKNDLDAEITLAGSFCTGECNRIGVTVQVDDNVYTDVTVEGFDRFFGDKILKPIREGA